MALKNKIMTAAEAKGLRDIHRTTWESIENKSKYGDIRTKLEAIASIANIWLKFMGPYGSIAAVTDILVNFVSRSNRSATISYFRGAEKAFEAVRNMISNGGYRAADVQMNWIKYTDVSTTCEFVQGNDTSPGLGYKIIKLQKSDGSWVNPPIGY